jgi:hypothetical protein
MDIQEQTPGKTGRHQWNKDPRLKAATISQEGQNIQQDLEEDPRAGDGKENGQNFYQDSKNECQDIVEELAPSKTVKETEHKSKNN